MTMDDKLKALLVDQYLLHEVDHHAALVAIDGAPVITEPRAHQLVDIYKCLHQGEFGVGHMIDEPQGFHDRLLRDFLTGSPQADAPVLEKVSADGTSLRLNLRPFRAWWDDNPSQACALLTDACVRSAAIRRGDSERFLACLNTFSALNRDSVLAVGPLVFRFQPSAVDQFLTGVRRLARQLGQLPVFGHSSTYNRFNRPSYRVVESAVIDQSPLASLIERTHEPSTPC